MQPVQIRRINPEDTLQLRRDVLYPDGTLEAMRVDHDEDGLHFGLFEDTRLRGIVSLFVQKDLAQFRKLAVHPDCQGKGYGSLLMQHVEDFCSKSEATRRLTGLYGAMPVILPRDFIRSAVMSSGEIISQKIILFSAR